jgi:hypothetical protein
MAILYRNGGPDKSEIPKRRLLKSNEDNNDMYADLDLSGIDDQEFASDMAKYVYKKVSPVGYSTWLGNIMHKMSTLAGLSDERIHTGKYSEEAWRKTLGGQAPSDVVVDAEYSPSVSSDKNAKYYKLNDINRKETLDNILDLLEEQEADRAVAGHGQGVELNSWDVDPLVYHTVSKGQDDRGNYVSYYDIFDFNNSLANKILEFIGGKPVEFYDRIYYDEYRNPIDMPPISERNGGILFKK